MCSWSYKLNGTGADYQHCINMEIPKQLIYLALGLMKYRKSETCRAVLEKCCWLILRKKKQSKALGSWRHIEKFSLSFRMKALCPRSVSRSGFSDLWKYTEFLPVSINCLENIDPRHIYQIIATWTAQQGDEEMWNHYSMWKVVVCTFPFLSYTMLFSARTRLKHIVSTCTHFCSDLDEKHIARRMRMSCIHHVRSSLNNTNYFGQRYAHFFHFFTIKKKCLCTFHALNAHFFFF